MPDSDLDICYVANLSTRRIHLRPETRGACNIIRLLSANTWDLPHEAVDFVLRRGFGLCRHCFPPKDGSIPPENGFAPLSANGSSGHPLLPIFAMRSDSGDESRWVTKSVASARVGA